jgi:hypothetical protein
MSNVLSEAKNNNDSDGHRGALSRSPRCVGTAGAVEAGVLLLPSLQTHHRHSQPENCNKTIWMSPSTKSSTAVWRKSQEMQFTCLKRLVGERGTPGESTIW